MEKEIISNEIQTNENKLHQLVSEHIKVFIFLGQLKYLQKKDNTPEIADNISVITEELNNIEKTITNIKKNNRTVKKKKKSIILKNKKRKKKKMNNLEKKEKELMQIPEKEFIDYLHDKNQAFQEGKISLNLLLIKNLLMIGQLKEKLGTTYENENTKPTILLIEKEIKKLEKERDTQQESLKKIDDEKTKLEEDSKSVFNFRTEE